MGYEGALQLCGIQPFVGKLKDDKNMTDKLLKKTSVLRNNEKKG